MLGGSLPSSDVQLIQCSRPSGTRHMLPVAYSRLKTLAAKVARLVGSWTREQVAPRTADERRGHLDALVVQGVGDEGERLVGQPKQALETQVWTPGPQAENRAERAHHIAVAPCETPTADMCMFKLSSFEGPDCCTAQCRHVTVSVNHSQHARITAGVFADLPWRVSAAAMASMTPSGTRTSLLTTNSASALVLRCHSRYACLKDKRAED